jgi:hypothetical protein
VANIKKGTKIRVIGDTFEKDPHGLEIGKTYTVDHVTPAMTFEEFPPMVQLLFLLEGIEPHDIPERVHIKFGNGLDDYGNVPLYDLEVIGEAQPAPTHVRMLEDDFFDGYSAGDVFEVSYDEEGDGFFTDHDGDTRFLVDHEHEIVE